MGKLKHWIELCVSQLMSICLVAEKVINYRISLTSAQKLKLSCVFIVGLENKLIVVFGSYTLVVRNYMRVLELLNASFGFPKL